MKRLLIALALSASTFSLPVFAACNAANSTCSGQLSRLIFDANGNMFLRLADTNIGNETNCSRATNYAYVPSTAPKFKEFYAMALTAYASEQNFAIRVLDDADCTVAYTFMVK